MKLSQAVKPASYLQGNANTILADLESKHEPVAITYNGEVKAVIQDIASYEATQETLALLKMLAMSSKSKREGKFKTASQSFSDIRNKIDDLPQ